MYNRYIPNGSTYTRVTVDDTPQQPPAAPSPPPHSQQEGHGPPPGQPHRPPEGPKYIPVNQAGQGNSTGIFPGAGMLDGLKLGKLGELFDRDKSGSLGGLLGALGLEDMDSGDVLLLLIILFLLLEGDNLELVITLGLMLLLGLNDKKDKHPDGGGPSGRRE